MSAALARVGPPAPVRIVHLGLGGFVRAHLARYTDLAPDRAGWGIAAFTGRRADLADQLTAQDGLYTLVTRGPQTDRFDVVASLSAAHAGPEHDRWLGYFADPALAIVSLTITEAGYDTSTADVAKDLAALRADPQARVITAPARLVAGLAQRRRAGLGPLAVVSCDNLPHNGVVTTRMLAETAGAIDPALAKWIDDYVSCPSSMVDRITPRTVDEDVELVRRDTGRDDRCPVITEPFSEWVISGDFPAGRPQWEQVGVRFVGDIGLHEQRKLWLLNGAHSILAYAGINRGHETVAEAVADPRCRAMVQRWWDEATRHLDLPSAQIANYRAALLDRFDNPRIAHRLSQIAADGSVKLGVRVVPVLRAERAAGRSAAAALTALGEWIQYLRNFGPQVIDPAAERLAALAAGQDVPALLSLLADDLAADPEVVAALQDYSSG